MFAYHVFSFNLYKVFVFYLFSGPGISMYEELAGIIIKFLSQNPVTTETNCTEQYKLNNINARSV